MATTKYNMFVENGAEILMLVTGPKIVVYARKDEKYYALPVVDVENFDQCARYPPNKPIVSISVKKIPMMFYEIDEEDAILDVILKLKLYRAA